MRSLPVLPVALLLALTPACSLARGVGGQGPGRDGGPDADLVDVGMPDSDAVHDTGPGNDTGLETDAGNDSGDVDGGTLPALDVAVGGVFARASEASVLTGAGTDGAAPFLSWIGPNVRRMEDRGDGLGPMLLIEGARTNLVISSRALSNPGAFGAVTAADTAPGPDGAMLADRTSIAASQYGDLRLVTTGSVLATASCWARRATGAPADVAHISLELGGVGRGAEIPLAGTYTRIAVTSAVTTSSAYYVPVDGRAGAGLSARALDYIHDLHQVELAPFPSSTIRTDGVPATRSAESLMYDVAQYPAQFRTSGFRVRFAPDFSSDDLVAQGSGAGHFVLDFGAPSSGVLLRNVAGVIIVTAGTAGVEINSGAVSWQRGQLLTLEVRPGSLTLTGFTSGNGSTPAAVALVWPAAPLVVGATDGSCFGRFEPVIQAL